MRFELFKREGEIGFDVDCTVEEAWFLIFLIAVIVGCSIGLIAHFS